MTGASATNRQEAETYTWKGLGQPSDSGLADAQIAKTNTAGITFADNSQTLRNPLFSSAAASAPPRRSSILISLPLDAETAGNRLAVPRGTRRAIKPAVSGARAESVGGKYRRVPM